MNPRERQFWLSLLLSALLCFRAIAGISESDLKQLGFDQHLGTQLSRELTFQESSGQMAALGELFHGKPILLVLGYYHCPMLCTLVNDGLIEVLQELRLTAGRDFDIINLSIDPRETPANATVKKREYLRRYGNPQVEGSWHFLTGSKGAIDQLTNECGFRFKLDPDSREYAHPSGFIVLTPEGRISRYFFGVNYDPRELQSAIVTASRGESGSLIRQLVLLCCRYSPLTGKYGNTILIVLRILGAGTVILLGGWTVATIRRESLLAR